MQHGFQALDLGLRAVDGGRGLISLRDRSLNARLGRFVIAAALIESLLGNNLLADELLSALEIGLGRSQHGIALGHKRFSLDQRLFGAIDVGLRRPQLGFGFR